MNAHNSSQFLAEALQSVTDQTWQSWEVILWDNASRDHSDDIAASFADPRIKYFAPTLKTSLYQARINALGQARGDLLAFLDCDDLWAPRKLEMQVPLFESSAVVASCSDYIVFYDIDQASSARPPHIFQTYSGVVERPIDAIRDYRVGLSSLMVRRESALASWPTVTPDYSVIEDYDMLVRLLSVGSLAPLHVPLMRYRIHGSNFSLRSDVTIAEWEDWQSDLGGLGLNRSEMVEVRTWLRLRLAEMKSREALRQGEGRLARAHARSMPWSQKRLKYWIASWLPSFLVSRLG